MKGHWKTLQSSFLNEKHYSLHTMSPKDLWYWFQGQDWYDMLEEINQEPRFHGEGNVKIHLDLVMEQLFKLPEYETLSNRDKKIVTVATALHDVGKLDKTTITDSGIHHYGHAFSSMKFAQMFLMMTDFPLEERVEIAHLIKHHDAFIGWTSNPKHQLLLAKLSWITPSLKKLLILSEADNKGRIAGDLNDILDGIEMLREGAKEMNCYENPYALKNSEAGVLLGRKKLSFLDFEPFVKYENQVVILSGFPGSGKSTYRNTFLKDYKVVCLDDIRKELNVRPGDWDDERKKDVSGVAHKRFKELLAKGEKIVIDRICLSPRTRKKLIGFVRSYKVKSKISLVYLEPPIKTLTIQNKDREDPVPVKFVLEMFRSFEYPDKLEAHSVEYLSTFKK